MTDVRVISCDILVFLKLRNFLTICTTVSFQESLITIGLILKFRRVLQDTDQAKRISFRIYIYSSYWLRACCKLMKPSEQHYTAQM
jgi:hypothetical protein